MDKNKSGLPTNTQDKNPNQIVALLRKPDGKITYEEAKRLIIPGGGFPDTLLENIQKVEDINGKADELVVLMITSGAAGSVLQKENWQKLTAFGMDKKAAAEAIIKKRSVPADEEGLQRMAMACSKSIGDFLNYLSETDQETNMIRVTGDTLRSIIKFAEDESLNQSVAEELLKKGYVDTTNKYINKFSKDVQKFIVNSNGKQ